MYAVSVGVEELSGAAGVAGAAELDDSALKSWSMAHLIVEGAGGRSSLGRFGSFIKTSWAKSR